MQKNDPGLPDFADFIEARRKEGKSTIRKEYFKYLIFSYPEEMKVQVFEKFLGEYEKSDPDEAQSIRILLQNNKFLT